eukprot:357633-Chlamydomonas_euryale.AAC.15
MCGAAASCRRPPGGVAAAVHALLSESTSSCCDMLHHGLQMWLHACFNSRVPIGFMPALTLECRYGLMPALAPEVGL